jgi:hypothetical protein
MTPVQLASTSKSGFEGAVYSGGSIELAQNPGVEEFRVFHQGASSFVPVGAVRQSAEGRAAEFCANSGKHMLVFSEKHSTPPHILGNFPRVELIFGCVDPNPNSLTNEMDELRIKNLERLKSLLDNEAITIEEYEQEKSKILGRL